MLGDPEAMVLALLGVPGDLQFSTLAEGKEWRRKHFCGVEVKGEGQ